MVNAVTNRDYDGFIGTMEYDYSHFLISEELYQEYKNTDCPWNLFGTDKFEDRDTNPNLDTCYTIWLKYYYSYSG